MMIRSLQLLSMAVVLVSVTSLAYANNGNGQGQNGNGQGHNGNGKGNGNGGVLQAPELDTSPLGDTAAILGGALLLSRLRRKPNE